MSLNGMEGSHEFLKAISICADDLKKKKKKEKEKGRKRLTLHYLIWECIVQTACHHSNPFSIQ